MKKIIQFIARKIHYALFQIMRITRSFWASSILGKSGKNLQILGNAVFFYPKNISIGDNCTINQGVLIDAREHVEIGNNVRISSYTLIETAYLEKDTNKVREHAAKSITIEDNVWIASGAKILAGVTIGRNSIIAAGAIVTKDIPANSIAKGMPAISTPLDK